MACALLLGACGAVNAQWLTGGNPINTTTQYLGCNASSTQPLRLKTEVNHPIEWYTDAVRWMLLMETGSYGVGGSTSQDKDGFLLLCPDVDQFYSNGAPGPYTTLHLAAADDNAQEAGYRPNMGNGITMTGNDDQMYVGQLFNGLDHTDAAIVWSDKQRLRQPRYYAL